ncbi:MAG: L-histidine N(alpha)-methyltransferase [Defluviitaleaceae bacterium]|nr:L-histidine N(alpha)-methyltransferase [Defluviitaleaceae bacterium]
MLLGNTLGNFEEDELLRKIKNAMNKNDLLLIDNQLKKDGELTSDDLKKLKDIYSSDLEKANLLAVLKKGNITNNHGDVVPSIQSSFDSAHLNGNNCVSVLSQFKFKAGVTVTVGDKKLSYEKDDIVTVSFSRKYTKSTLENIVTQLTGLEIVDDYSNTEYAMMLCRKP